MLFEQDIEGTRNCNTVKKKVKYRKTVLKIDGMPISHL